MTEDKFLELVHEHQAQIYQHTYYLLGNREDAEDVIDLALKDEASANVMRKHLWNSEADWWLQRSSLQSC